MKERLSKENERIWNLTRLFNIRETGISRKDDTLPPRIFEEPYRCPQMMRREFHYHQKNLIRCLMNITSLENGMKMAFQLKKSLLI